MIFSVVGIFALTGDLIKLKCDCGGSELTATYTNDRKVRISVPCVVCADPHIYVIGTGTFFGDDVFRLSCTYSGIDICLIGKKEAVAAAAEKADEDFLRLLQVAGVEDFNTFA